MNRKASPDSFAVLSEPATLTIERLLPGPVDRIWSYLTESDLRRKWLASGTMEENPGTNFTLTWRNDELTDPPGKRPEGFSEEHSMESRVIEADKPRKLAFTFGQGEVTITLEPKGNDVLLRLVHIRLPEGVTRINVASGWHSHLDMLVARISGSEPEPFWDHWGMVKAEYEKRIPA